MFRQRGQPSAKGYEVQMSDKAIDPAIVPTKESGNSDPQNTPKSQVRISEICILIYPFKCIKGTRLAIKYSVSYWLS